MGFQLPVTRTRGSKSKSKPSIQPPLKGVLNLEPWVVEKRSHTAIRTWRKAQDRFAACCTNADETVETTASRLSWVRSGFCLCVCVCRVFVYAGVSRWCSNGLGVYSLAASCRVSK